MKEEFSGNEKQVNFSNSSQVVQDIILKGNDVRSTATILKAKTQKNT